MEFIVPFMVMNGMLGLGGNLSVTEAVGWLIGVVAAFLIIHYIFFPLMDYLDARKIKREAKKREKFLASPEGKRQIELRWQHDERTRQLISESTNNQVEHSRRLNNCLQDLTDKMVKEDT